MNMLISDSKNRAHRSPAGSKVPAHLHLGRARRRLGRRGMTLVEVIVSTSIAALVGAAVMGMVLSLGKMNFDSAAKLSINKDVRSFTNELSFATRSARVSQIYAAADDLTARESGETGDVLVLVWAQPESVADATMGRAQEFFYQKIIIFARTVEDDDANVGPVVRYERKYALPSSSSGGTPASENDLVDLVEAVIKNDDNLTDVREVIELTRGLADEKLFFRSRLGDSITVNGELYHGNDGRRVTNTYNFTVAPRG